MNDTRIALVTGANNGIGKEIARQLIGEGFTVLVGARDESRGRVAVEELGGNARLLVLDVTDAASIEAAAATVPAIDVLVNNAGISDALTAAPDTDIDVFRRVYETNVFGLAAVTNAFLPALRASAHPSIVNITSGTGSLGWSTGPNPQFDWTLGTGRSAAYRSSKAAVNALTIFYGQALEADGVKVNALAPGLRRTNLNGRASTAPNAGDPAEAAAGAVRLALLPDDGPTAGFFSWDGTVAAW